MEKAKKVIVTIDNASIVDWVLNSTGSVQQFVENSIRKKLGLKPKKQDGRGKIHITIQDKDCVNYLHSMRRSGVLIHSSVESILAGELRGRK